MFENTTVVKFKSLVKVLTLILDGQVYVSPMFTFFNFPQVSQHPHTRLREWGADALTSLVRSAMTFNFESPLSKDLVSEDALIIFNKSR